MFTFPYDYHIRLLLLVGSAAHVTLSHFECYTLEHAPISFMPVSSPLQRPADAAAQSANSNMQTQAWQLAPALSNKPALPFMAKYADSLYNHLAQI
jgi:hypothetical protein